MMRGTCVRRAVHGIQACGLAGLWLLATVPFPLQAQTAEAAHAVEFAPPAARAISLTPHITELIFAAGAGDNIAATVTSSNYPPAALTIPRIGDGLNINVEKTLAVRPDVVIAWQPSGSALTLAPVLSQLKIPLIYSAPRTLRDIPAEISRFGKLFHTENVADPAARALADRLQALRTQYAHRAPVSVFVEIGADPIYTLGNDPLLNDALDICGGVNIYANAAVAAPQVSAESVLVAQPKVVITSAVDPIRLAAARDRWSRLRLPAALQGHVYGIDPDKLFRPGPRLIDATEALCRYIDEAR